MKRCCDVFNIYRSSYKYWAKQVRCIKPEKVKALVMVKSIHAESNSSAGARTISIIATTRGLTISRDAFDKRAKLSQLQASKS
ncbi:MAG TPA: hypothetical protein DIS98_11625 [Colwellia sp.]|nr:hypothetical protein [Colwellia sp.]